MLFDVEVIPIPNKETVQIEADSLADVIDKARKGGKYGVTRIKNFRLPERPYKDGDLVYAAFQKCKCGAGLAHLKYLEFTDLPIRDCLWECSDILTGRADPSKPHSPPLSFDCYDIIDEDPDGHTTRPIGR